MKFKETNFTLRLRNRSCVRRSLPRNEFFSILIINTSYGEERREAMGRERPVKTTHRRSQTPSSKMFNINFINFDINIYLILNIHYASVEVKYSSHSLYEYHTLFACLFHTFCTHSHKFLSLSVAAGGKKSLKKVTKLLDLNSATFSFSLTHSFHLSHNGNAE